MTPADFSAFIATLRDKEGGALTNQRVADLLGLSSPRAILDMKRNGVKGHTARRTALACAAILAGLEPFGE